VASAFDLGVRTPEIPVASNVAIIALLNLNLIVFLLLLVPPVPQPREAFIRAPPQGARLEIQGEARLLVPRPRRGAGHRDLRHRVELHRPLDRRMVQAAGGAALDQALSVAQTYYRDLETSALRQAHHIAGVIERDGLLASDRRDTLVAYLTEHQDQVGLSAITVVGRNRGEIAHVKDPVIGDLPLREVGEGQLRHGLAGRKRRPCAS